MYNGSVIDAAAARVEQAQKALDKFESRFYLMWGPFMAAFFVLAVLDDERGRYWLLGFALPLLQYFTDGRAARKALAEAIASHERALQDSYKSGE